MSEAGGWIALSGRYRDRLIRAGRRPRFGPWQANLICFSGLDLVGRLLCNDSQLTGLSWCAFGEGRPEWDNQPPPADRTRRSLTSEIARVPVADADWRSQSRMLRIRLTLGPGIATGTLREFGLFGGNASARPDSGILLNHKSHDPKDKGPDDTLDREIAIELSDRLAPGARDLIGQMLAGRAGVVGLSHMGFGSSGAQAGATRHSLAAETLRVPLVPRRVAYDSSTRAVSASAELPTTPGRDVIREVGLFGGDPSGRPDTGFLVDRTVIAEVARDHAVTLVPRFRIELAAHRLIEVPDLTTGSADEAMAALAAIDLQLGRLTWRAVANRARGRVLSQAPTARSQVTEGTAIDVVVSQGAVAEVPDAIGAPLDVAQSALRDAGFAVEVRQRESAATTGIVLACDPPAGTLLAKNETVTVTVSAALMADVPELIGRARAIAELLARAAGFTVADDDPATVESTRDDGTVVKQDPAPPNLAAVDTPIRVTLATSFKVEVPSVIDKDEDDAAALLAAAAAEVMTRLGLPPDPPGLVIGVRRAVAVERPEDPLGIIKAQVPDAGAMADLYSTVEIDVSAAIDRPVPSVVNKAEADAKAALMAAGFAPGLVTQRASSDKTPGIVLLQDPAANSPWPAGGRVALVVAQARTVAVPTLVGQQQAVATETLVSRGLVVGTVRSRPSQNTPGTVTAQRPDADTVVDSGSAVHLDIAAGVPGVVGRTVDDAIAAITGAGLNAVRHEVESPTQSGLVVAQRPPAGTPADPGSDVEIDVAVPILAEVPEVTGRPVSDAESLLRAAGLEMAVARREDEAVDENMVLEQDPAAQERIAVGSTVTVTIAVAPQRVEVPDLTGLTPDVAKVLCARAQLGMDVAGEVSSPRVAAGLVASQDPAAGVLLVIGKPVQVWLASERGAVIPNLIGLLLADADGVARRAGFITSVLPGTRTPLRPDIVIVQRPIGDLTTTAPPGTAIFVTLGFAMPKLIGLDRAAAELELRNRGLAWTVRAGFSRRPTGEVTAQMPEPGTPVPMPNLQITVTVSSLQIDPRVIPERPPVIVRPDPEIIRRLIVDPPPPVINPRIVRPPIR